MKDTLKVKLLCEDAKLPTRGSEKAAGYDLYSCENVTLPVMGIAKIKTGVSIAIFEHHYGRIAPRSSLGVKGIMVHAGVIDSDYRGEIIVVLQNLGKSEYVIHKQDKIAQLILEKISMPQIVQVSELDDTVRGEQGFGSTGH